MAELADEAFLSTQTAAENMGAGELDHLGQEGSQFSINHLEGEEERGMKRGRRTEDKDSKMYMYVSIYDNDLYMHLYFSPTCIYIYSTFIFTFLVQLCCPCF